MDEETNYSRVNKYDKRRKTTKSITILMAIAVLLVILLIGIWLFGGKKDKDDDKQEQSQQGTEEVEEGSDDNSNQSSDDSSATDEEKDEDTEESTGEDENEEESEDDDSIEIEEIPEDEIDDSNVIEAYTANWKPIGTSQEEPHTTKYDKGSDDWNEMMEAIAYALEIEKDEIISHWIGNGGEQRVNGYVQSTVTDEHYTVYLEWKENEGWQPIKVERVEKFIHPKQAE